MHSKKQDDYINPLDFLEEREEIPAGRKEFPRKSLEKRTGKTVEKEAAPSKAGKGIFITGTDTAVGKTVAVQVLGMLLQKQGLDIGVYKPVQCAGKDAAQLKKSLNIKDSLQDINPYFAKEPLSPHLAFARQKTKIEIRKILEGYRKISARHDWTLVEGAGGLLVPITENYLVADLIRDLDLEVIIVSRLGLGTINHTLLTIEQAKKYGLDIKGILFNETQPSQHGVPEKTNPEEIQKISGVKVLGTIPAFKSFHAREVFSKAGKIDVQEILRSSNKPTDTRQLRYWDKRYVWHPFTQMKDWFDSQPLVIEKGQGCYLIDSDGNRYLDGVSSLWVNVHGHRHPRIDTAVSEQLNKISHSTMLGLTNPPAVELARKLARISPRGLEKVFYSDSGSTAVEIAVKMAYQYWQNTGNLKKKRFVHLSHSYHGDTLGSVSVGGIDLFHKVYKDLVIKTYQVNLPDGYRAPEGKKYPEYFLEHLDRAEEFLKEKQEKIAALIVEPLVQGAAGMIVWPNGVLKRFRQMCDKYNILLIADEVATGFGRTGRMFACDHEKVTPDILCLAKGITGGYLPLAATLTTRKIFDGFVFDYKEQKTFFHGHTYTGNPLGCAAALANLEIFEKEGVLQNLRPKIKYLRDKLKMFYNLPHVGQVRQKGMMAGIELVADKGEKTSYPWEEKTGVRVCEEARENGVILRPLGNVIVLMPPLAVSIEELEKILKVTYRAIEKVTGARQGR